MSSPPKQPLHLPRILCLHGSGTTAEIFTIQCRGLLAALSPHFRLVFADAPFFCRPGPGIIPFFAGMGPYRRWVSPELGDERVAVAVERQLMEAMGLDDARGGTEDWVGLLGFSQGTKLSASILYDIQLRREAASRDRVSREAVAAGEEVTGFAGGKWQFAILMNGRGPLMDLAGADSDGKRESLVKVCALTDAKSWDLEREQPAEMLALPTIHVHGLLDPDLESHRRLLRYCCGAESTPLIEWDGDHRVPIKPDVVKEVLRTTLALAADLGILERSRMESNEGFTAI